MARQAKELATDSRGNFVRNLGWKLTPTGGRVQHRFYLGKDLEESLRRVARLQELWDIIQNEAVAQDAAIWTHTRLCRSAWR